MSTRDWIELVGFLLIAGQLHGIGRQLEVLLTKYDYINGIRGMEWQDGGKR